MRVFIAGATGAVGRRLVPMLVSRGYQVTASTQNPERVEALRAQGAEPVIMDGLKSDSVSIAVARARPDVIVHEMTALASMRNLKNFDSEFAVTNRLRTEGTEHLIAAAEAVGTRRLLVQSFTGWPNSREGSRIKTEQDPLDSSPPKTMARTLAAIRELERLTLNAAGIVGTVLRYGMLYGPGTSIAADGEVIKLVRQRKFPIVGSGNGVWSFVHVDDAAGATCAAIEANVSGVYNIVDDEPAEVATWLPELAKAVGAKPPRHVPVWLGRLAIGESGVLMMTDIRGSSNENAKRAFAWTPMHANWREGFRGLAHATSFGRKELQHGT